MEPVFPNTPEARARRSARANARAERERQAMTPEARRQLEHADAMSAAVGASAIGAMRERGELTLLDVDEARDAAWRVVTDALNYALEESDGAGSTSLDAAVSAWRTLRDVAEEDTGTVAALRERLRHATADLDAADARINDLEGMAVRVTKAAKDAGGLDAFTGRYEVLGAELVNLDSLVDQ